MKNESNAKKMIMSAALASIVSAVALNPAVSFADKHEGKKAKDAKADSKSKCGEGKCGGDKKKSENGCGEGECGSSDKE